MEITILRLGHRIFRDQRITTHCALTARAFGCKRMIYSGEKDEETEKSVKEVVERWGNSFEIKYEKNWKRILKEWKGYKILLTMYGINLPDIIKEIQNLKKDLLIIIGSEKVPSDVYDLIDYQVAVTNQPHSEVAALAVFLDWYFKGKELKKKFSGKIKIIGQRKGKKIINQ